MKQIRKINQLSVTSSFLERVLKWQLMIISKDISGNRMIMTSVWNGHQMKNPRLLNIFTPRNMKYSKLFQWMKKKDLIKEKDLRVYVGYGDCEGKFDFAVCRAGTETVKKAENFAFRSVLTIPRVKYQGSIDKKTRRSIWHHNCNFEAHPKKRLVWRWNATNRSKTFKAGWNKILPILL